MLCTKQRSKAFFSPELVISYLFLKGSFKLVNLSYIRWPFPYVSISENIVNLGQSAESLPNLSEDILNVS